MKRMLALCLAGLMLAATGCTAREKRWDEQIRQEEAAKLAAEEAEQQAEEVDFSQFDQYMTPSVNLLTQGNWSDFGDIDPNRLILTYIRLFAPEPDEEGGATAEIPAQELAESLEEYFEDVDLEHLYGANAYQGGIDAFLLDLELDGVDYRITGANELGQTVRVSYQVDGRDGNPLGTGTLVVKTDGTRWFYSSCRYQEDLSRSFVFPASTRVQSSGNQVTMDAAGTVEQDGIAYDGEDLDSIISFYRQALEDLEAEGEEEALDDGWSWSGTYGDGSLSVEIVMGEAGEDDDEAYYRITVRY